VDPGPSLAGREADRVKAVKKQRNFLIIGVVLAIAGTAIGFGVFQEPFGLFLGALAGFGMYAWGSADITRLGKETKLMLVEPVAAEFNIAYELAPPRPDDMMTHSARLISCLAGTVGSLKTSSPASATARRSNSSRPIWRRNARRRTARAARAPHR